MNGTASTAPSTVAVIGAGVGGLALAYYLKQAGIDDFLLFEKADALGGVWRDNTYPGAACDIPSHLYSYSFEPHYPWAHRYGKQAEILAYLNHCADKYALRPHIRLGHEVAGADFDEPRGVWTLRFADGRRHEARLLISSVGQLHRPAIPAIPGQQAFRGKVFHSARWDHGYDLRGKTVAVIGTGASAVQFVPEIARQVAQLYLYQRSPGWVAPKVEKPFSRLERWVLDHVPLLQDIDRGRVFLLTEFLGYSYRGHKLAEQLPTWLAKTQLRWQVRDPALRRKLLPDYPIGCKRILLSTAWLPTLCRANVELVTDAISRIEADGVRSTDGQLRKADTLIYGTGFTATEFLAPMQIRGRHNRELSATWRAGAQAYLGMAVAGFPNFFVMYGPNTNLGSGSIIFMLERQARYITRLTRTLIDRRLQWLEVSESAQHGFVAEMRRRSASSTYAGDCQSWYKNDAGINTNNWVGSMREYDHRTRAPALADYRLVEAPSAGLPQAA